MTPRTGLVVELRFELDGNLIEAFLPPIVPSDGVAIPFEAFWYIEVNQEKAFRGPRYGVHLLGQEAAAETEIREFLELNPPLLAR